MPLLFFEPHESGSDPLSPWIFDGATRWLLLTDSPSSLLFVRGKDAGTLENQEMV